MIDYAGLTKELHIIIFSRQTGKPAIKAADNLWVYPTNSCCRWRYIGDTINQGKDILKREGRWLITAQDPFETGLAGYCLAKKNKLPLQLQLHTDFLNPFFREESFLNKVRVYLAKYLLPKANHIRVVSERIKKSLLKLGLSEKIMDILPIFVDTEKIKAAPIKNNLHQKYPQFSFIILMASRLTKEKNIKSAIEMMAELIKRAAGVGLIIVGEGPEKNSLELQIKKLGLTDKIIFEPWNEDLVSYYKTANLFLLTSNYEGYGLVAAEALVAGCPVVMTDVGCAGELIKNTQKSLIVPIGDKQKLAGAILKIIKEKDNFSEEIFKKIKWPNKKEYLEFYRGLWEKAFGKK
jgi:glycosyltransferase involved in cell wall biosynthesis